MPQYKVVNYTNIMGSEGMWEVNDAHFTGDEIELSEDATGRDVMNALKEAGVCTKNCQLRWLEIDMGSEDIYIRQASNGKWLWELRMVREEAAAE